MVSPLATSSNRTTVSVAADGASGSADLETAGRAATPSPDRLVARPHGDDASGPAALTPMKSGAAPFPNRASVDARGPSAIGLAGAVAAGEAVDPLEAAQ